MTSKKIAFFSLVLLIVAAIDSVRNLPAAALFGSALIFFFVLSALIFLIPVSLVSAELAATFPDKGGVFYWVKKAFGDRWAMLAIWLQWINTMVWYPSMLSFIAATAAFVINPNLADNKVYLISSILVIFWSLTLLNLRGLHVSARVNSVCALVGTVLPMFLLITLGCVWIGTGRPLQIEINASNLIPSLGDSTNWISLIAIMASFLGMELSGVHVGDIHNPQRNFPRAVFLASFFILITMLFGSLSIAFVLPQKQISLVAGMMQVLTEFFDSFGMKGIIPVLTVLVVMGTIGSIINWLISPAKGLLQAAEIGFLPPFFAHKNRHGVASRILMIQACIVTIVCFCFLLVPTINAFYWFLTALSTELYMIMYILMFAAALKLRKTRVSQKGIFTIPGKKAGLWLCTLLGLCGCLLTIFISFLPPGNVIVGSSNYLLMIILGNALTISPVFLFYLYHKKRAS